jgi:hypothetical protein
VKQGELRSIAHNVADSFASGVGIPVGVYATDIFGEAEKTPDRFITVDFLNGKVAAGSGSARPQEAVRLYRDVLESVCTKHGASVSAFRMLTARYSAGRRGRRVVVAIEDRDGHRSVDEYVGAPLRHMKTVDDLGRVRPLRKPRWAPDG